MQNNRKVNQDKWYELVEKYQSSEMSKKAFCELEQINPGTFQYWVKKYDKPTQTETSGFITLRPSIGGSRIFIRYGNGVELELPAQISTQQIIQLVRLGSC